MNPKPSEPRTARNNAESAGVAANVSAADWKLELEALPRLPYTPSSSPQSRDEIAHLLDGAAFKGRHDDTAVTLWNDMYARTLRVFAEVVENYLRVPSNGYLLGKATQRVQRSFQESFGTTPDASDVCAVFSTTGTAANRICTSPFLNQNRAIVSTSKAHLNEREGRSVESQTGSSVYQIPLGTEPLTPTCLQELLKHRRDHFEPITQTPLIFSLTNPEEDGYVYRPHELRALAEVVHEHKMLFHIDGARIFHAAAALGVPPRAITTDVGVDTIGIGGSKSGLFLANASVFLPSFFTHGYQARLHNFETPAVLFDYLRGFMKRGGLLCGQSESLAAQFMVGLHDDLLVRVGAKANENARVLADVITRIPGCHLYQPIASNVAMISVPRIAHENLLRHFDGVKVWYDPDPVRPENLVCRFIASATFERSTIDLVARVLSDVLTAKPVA